MSKKPFIPPKLPIKIDYEPLIGHITKAHRAIAGLDALLSALPNPSLLGRTLQTKEAVLSSQIEGTQATLDEVLAYEAVNNKNESATKKQDINEIINYRKALDLGIKSLDTLPLSENLIKKLHATLLKSGRGENKAPGEFRKIQVFIGIPGADISEATYIPPTADEIIPLFSNLEKYLNSDEEKDNLVQIAIAHYQFEAIHPFLDGNGRVGRLIISLFLYEKKLLAHPFLYLSEFFEEHRTTYYELLRNVSEKQDWENWIKFFLNALTIQAQKAEEASKSILKLNQELKDQILALNSQYAPYLLDAIFVRPIFSASSIQKHVKIKNTQTLYTLIGKFVDMGILKEVDSKQKRNKVYRFEKLIKILNL
ncbi:MAG: Filamentation induced by cAMP protein Fic [uncultured bacterium]|nr:MAG: Filamentation induced by cAMP protein Fic [uncultured bacterium]HBR79883.1 cell filamentation protein Fic [Candidatus Moranbacteria bacterium]